MTNENGLPHVPEKSLAPDLQAFLLALADGLDGGKREGMESPLAWGRAHMRTERGQVLDFETYRFMQEPLRAWDMPRLGLMCGSQIGKTTLGITRVYGLADVRAGTRIIYTMHTQVAVDKFSATRAKPAIEASPYLAARIGGVNNVGIKTFDHAAGQSVIFFNGASEGQQALSEPADMVVHDELDFSRPDVLRLYQDRTARSPLDYRMVFGTPTVPGFGLSSIWDESTQGEWFVKCPTCSWEGPIEWPTNVTEEMYCCSAGHELPFEAIRTGRWVHGRPGAEWTMYHVPRMLLPNWTADRVYREMLDEDFPQLAANQILGIPASSPDMAISEDMLVPVLGAVERAEVGDARAYFIGADVGKDLHVMVGREADSGDHEYVWVGKTNWDGLGRLMRAFRARICVVDALPETTKAGDFAREFPRRVMLAYYPTMPIKGSDPIRENKDEQKVDLDRTVTLDQSAQRLIEQRDRFCPMSDHDRREFTLQMTAMQRALVTGSDGRPVARWQETRADHYRHAHNYATAAAALVGHSVDRLPARSGIDQSAAFDVTVAATGERRIVRPLVFNSPEVQAALDSIDGADPERLAQAMKVIDGLGNGGNDEKQEQGPGQTARRLPRR